jgi:hypothetical protein
MTSLKNLRANTGMRWEGVTNGITIKGSGKKKRSLLICGKFLTQSPGAGQEKPEGFSSSRDLPLQLNEVKDQKLVDAIG